MTELGFVREALTPFLACVDVGERIAVPTQCLYPSNASVTVYLTGGPQGARVSDEGGAIDELSAHGRSPGNPDRYLRRFCNRAALMSERGKIYSPVVPLSGLAAAITLVANTSAAAAHWGIEHLKFPRRRDLRKELYEVLRLRFPEDRIEGGRRLTGKSTRQYRFDQVVRLNGERLLVIDSVLPDANSINSHTVAHLDIRQNDDPNVLQRLVYDDEEHWNAADLNLLQMAATLVPFSNVGSSLDRLRPH